VGRRCGTTDPIVRENMPVSPIHSWQCICRRLFGDAGGDALTSRKFIAFSYVSSILILIQIIGRLFHLFGWMDVECTLLIQSNALFTLAANISTMGGARYSQAYPRFGGEKKIRIHICSIRNGKEAHLAALLAHSLRRSHRTQTVICPFPSSVPRPRPGAAGTMQMQPGAVDGPAAAPRPPPTRAPPIRPASPQCPRAAQSAQKVRPPASPPNPQWPNFVA
jgi:hypothetical protein